MLVITKLAIKQRTWKLGNTNTYFTNINITMHRLLVIYEIQVHTTIIADNRQQPNMQVNSK
jgi:hypothetical protein